MTSPLLEARHLIKNYRAERQGERRVLNDISFTLEPFSIAALTGPSGSGKSTLLRCLCSLECPDAGSVLFEGLPLGIRKWARTAPVQMIFQDPGASLNPRFTAFEIVAEPLRIFSQGRRQSHRHVVSELLDVTGLSRQCARRKAWQFSGGQRTRLAIARALAANPRLLLLDESLSGLDVSVRGQIVNLLLDLQRWRNLSYLLVTHDLGLAAALTDKVLLLEQGRLLEEGRLVANGKTTFNRLQLEPELEYTT